MTGRDGLIPHKAPSSSIVVGGNSNTIVTTLILLERCEVIGELEMMNQNTLTCQKCFIICLNTCEKYATSKRKDIYVQFKSLSPTNRSLCNLGRRFL